jgi:hypothetical protein
LEKDELRGWTWIESDEEVRRWLKAVVPEFATAI